MRCLLNAVLVCLLVARSALAEPDWEALTNEATQLLSVYTQIDTTNPPGNELPAAELLKSVLAKEGVEARLYPNGENRANLVARWKGSGKKQPLLLVHHMDVVPAVAADWSFPPFSGAIADGFVYGRGTLDDKSHGVGHLGALLARHREHKSCSRDLIFLAVADEEVGGAAGAEFMVKHHLDDIRAEAVWNEGGATVEGILPDRKVNSIAVTEKNALWITLKATGEGGHGSAPTPDGGINVLLRALEKISAWRRPLHLDVTMREGLRRMGAAAFPGAGLLAANLDRPPLSWLAQGTLRSHRVLNGITSDTISLTGLRAGLKHNVIPGHAEADIDVRLLPDTKPEKFLADLKAVIDDERVSVEVVHDVPTLQPPASPDTSFFQALQQAIEKHVPDSVTIPGMLTGSSDCRSFRSAGMACYGYQPLIASQDLIARFHGRDERIAISDLRLGLQVTYDTLEILCRE